MFQKIFRLARRTPVTSPPVLDVKALQEAAGGYFHLPDLVDCPRHSNEAVIRSLCRTTYLGDHTAICKVLGRYRLFVDTKDVGLGIHLLTYGYWEMWHTEAMFRLVRPGMKAVDVGANLGYFTLLLGELVGATGSVHAFEPNPNIAAHLRNSIHVNGMTTRITLHECALSDADGLAGLAIEPGEPKNAQIVRADSRAATVEVQTRRIDGMAELADADFIKIDVEGAEEGLWRGMERFLSGRRAITIILEFTAARYRDAGRFIDEILSSGFSLDVIDPVDGIVPLTRDALLARPSREDQLIVLRR